MFVFCPFPIEARMQNPAFFGRITGACGEAVKFSIRDQFEAPDSTGKDQ